MKNIFSVLLVLFSITIIFSDYGKDGKVYSCDFPEGHPDVPIEVKEECRRLNHEYQKFIEEKKYRTTT